MISMAREIARMVGPSFTSPVPLRPTTKPHPRNVFSSCPFTRQMFFSRVLALADTASPAITQHAIRSDFVIVTILLTDSLTHLPKRSYAST